MILRFILPLFLLFQSMDAQEYDLKASSIPEALKENADAVIRLDKVDITIASVKSMNVKKTRIVTVLNESGLRAMDAEEYFSKSETVKSIEAIIYDGSG